MNAKKLLLVAVALASFSANAIGQTITATLTEVSPGTTVHGTVDGSYFQDWRTGITAFDSFDGFCVEPGSPLSYGQTVIYQIQDPSTLSNVGTIARLIGGYLASDMSDAQASAVQWAIWEVLDEASGSLNLYDGNVMISTDTEIADLANQYLLNVDTYTPVELAYYTNENFQNVATWQIPEPASAGLAALSGLLLFRRRR